MFTQNKINGFLILACFVLGPFSWAQVRITRNPGAAKAASKSDINYRIEPIAGLETVFRDSPTPHTSTRAIYGLRLVAGADWLSAETEYTKAEDTENYTTAPEKVVNKDEKLKLGLRTTKNLGSVFFTTFRVGGQATHHINESTSSGITTTTDKPITYAPYAGLQLGLRLGNFAQFSVGSTMVFTNNQDFSKNEVQNTVSLSLGI